jgi:hypothetical protein
VLESGFGRVVEVILVTENYMVFRPASGFEEEIRSSALHREEFEHTFDLVLQPPK